MPRFDISNITSGQYLGEFEAADEAGARDALARDAGYTDYAHACETVGFADLVVTKVEGRYRTEFPDFDPATLPPIPSDWEDTSWHNNTCPSFSPRGSDVAVYVNYLDETDRDWPGGKRYAVVADDNIVLLESDDWDETVARVRDYVEQREI